MTLFLGWYEVMALLAIIGGICLILFVALVVTLFLGYLEGGE